MASYFYFAGVADDSTAGGKHSLRGADLWHLAAAMTLKRELPELWLMTFDQRLKTAAELEGIG